jgi:hypothetical protein
MGGALGRTWDGYGNDCMIHDGLGWSIHLGYELDNQSLEGLIILLFLSAICRFKTRAERGVQCSVVQPGVEEWQVPSAKLGCLAVSASGLR